MPRALKSSDDVAARIQGRVHWLDRYRRRVAIAIAAAIAPILILQLAEALGTHWPRIHAVMMCGMVGVIVWWMIEVALAWLTAVWETECDRLTRPGGLPRAALVTRRQRARS